MGGKPIQSWILDVMPWIGKEDPTVHVYFFVDLCLSVMATKNTRNRGFNHLAPPYSKVKGAVSRQSSSLCLLNIIFDELQAVGINFEKLLG